MDGAAGGSGGTVNIRATNTLDFSTEFIAQFTEGPLYFPPQPFDVSGGIMNPDTQVAGAAAGV